MNKRLLIVGAGKGGTEVLKMLLDSPLVTVAAVIDSDIAAEGLKLARSWGIQTSSDWRACADKKVDFVIETTGQSETFVELKDHFSEAVVLPGEFIRIVVERLKQNQQMLEAIIDCTSEAISVADHNGNTILINPSYTRLTGFKKEDVVDKPATADIGMQESVHLKVLSTGQGVRDIRMQIGATRRDILVNAEPIVVEGKLRGSVGVIRDVSQIRALRDELKEAKTRIRNLEAKYQFTDIIATSEAMRFVIEQARLAALTPVTVLIRGESGTGKELFAHAIHGESPRKFKKFVRVNCAAISPTLLESELFGYEDGAFSGARRGGKVGYFEEADGGSLFLDEIGELPVDVQVKLLRVLQEHEIVRVGGTNAIPVDVRIIAATNANLEQKVADGTFREDLYYRINRMPIHIPPLRDRLEEIEPLCERIIRKLNQEYGRLVHGVDQAAIELLKSQYWKGNVRELENVIGRAMIYMASSEQWIAPHHLQLSTRTVTARSVEAVSLQDAVARYERDLIDRAIAEADGNKSEAARRLHISIRTLYNKLERLQ
ncbi:MULTISPECIES: sigma 54-interacting transcriptional regulator [unclassified Exiguobacterium]|uniref:sigma 54-interacting transcriptional regulator n=1 Tax=unclassified Exiguobacterium TaxID=2644629 RepID=UPI00103879D9|nr:MULTISPECIES: sigma 54-interacting transcriptional regulator [unclassified Exiguobacterium]TCI39653.1 PAS domain S-box protein [Exiguobacterium sp. SH4S7]TCI47651.1 PAS domain S-box protein [Exiguobacterium sp. SH5S32]TCI54537.1 PAS domain S-box protein [Exiguobacterium sp. SH1S4]TCI61387.1 PAS domain S-box protein [Exiguobacterium sp. SH0S2]TCI74331.1 PAS domain S-box protein [Exiguobacterium sp. SH1S1]